MSMLLPASTTSQAPFVATRTPASSLIGLQSQQAKAATGSVFAQNIAPQGAQAVYMPFDPQTIGTSTLFGLNQQSQATQRQLIGHQQGVLSDSMRQAGAFQSNRQLQQQQYQPGFHFQQKQPFETNQPLKAGDQPVSGANQTRSELAKHVNAKPFEPPKRLSTPTSTPSSSPGISSLMTQPSLVPVNLMSVRPSPPNASALSHSPPISSSFIPNRTVSVSPVDPTIPFPQAVGTFPKQAALGQFHLQQQMVPPQQFTPFQQQQVRIQPTQAPQVRIRPHSQQPQHHGIGSITVSGTPVMPSQAILAATMQRHLIRAPGQGSVISQPNLPISQRFPGPIQRPLGSGAMQHGQPLPIQPPRVTHAVAPLRMPSAKQSMQTAKPHLQGPPAMPQQQMFRSQQHQKMMESTRMFFAQQEQPRQTAKTQQQQQPLQPQSQGQQQLQQPVVQQQQQQQQQQQKQQQQQQQQKQQQQQQQQILFAEQRSKAAAATAPTQVSKPSTKPQAPSHKQEKKEPKSHIIELNPNLRNKKPNAEAPNKSSKPNKDSSKPENDKKQFDGKGASSKSRGPVRIQPFPQRGTPGSNRGRPARGRYSKAPAPAVNKPKVESTTPMDKPGNPSKQDTAPKNADTITISP